MMKLSVITSMTLMGSVVAAVLTKSWFMLWLGMEINMVGMTIQLMGEQKSEKLIMFFIFQSMPSMLILIYLLMTANATEMMMSPKSESLIVLALIGKVGMFPLQKWIMSMSKSMSWMNNLVVMTWQKVIPLLLLMKMKWSSTILTCAIVSMVVMCSIMLSSSSMKPFLMASSMVHVSWMMMMMNPLKLAPTLYLMMYSSMTVMLVKKMWTSNKKMMNEQMKKILTPTKVLMLSMSGMPPTMGFTMKMVAISVILMATPGKKILMLILGVATVSFYCYMQMLWKSMTLMKNSKKSKKELTVDNPTKMMITNIMLAPTLLLL